ncbi:Uncharacterized protein FKW44_019053, partial [Caligus rogercresseyi]
MLACALISIINVFPFRYKALIRKLPVINYNTLRRLISHLSAIASQDEPGLHLGSYSANCRRTKGQRLCSNIGESDVCRDLIEHYSELFEVQPEELERERLITEVLTQISSSHDSGQHGHFKRSGEDKVDDDDVTTLSAAATTSTSSDVI